MSDEIQKHIDHLKSLSPNPLTAILLDLNEVADSLAQEGRGCVKQLCERALSLVDQLELQARSEAMPELRLASPDLLR